MSQIAPTNAQQLPPTVTDANTAQNRPQPGTPAAPRANAPAVAPPTDPVQISAAAQVAVGQGRGPALSEADAQSTATDLRQQIGLFGLSASAKQNASVLALLRPTR